MDGRTFPWTPSARACTGGSRGHPLAPRGLYDLRRLSDFCDSAFLSCNSLVSLLFCCSQYLHVGNVPFGEESYLHQTEFKRALLLYNYGALITALHSCLLPLLHWLYVL